MVPSRVGRWAPAATVAVVLVCGPGGCDEPAAHVKLVPLGGTCGRPADATLLKVTSYGAHGEHSESLAIDQSLAIADFPAETEQIGVEVIVGGGATGAQGKSAPLDFGALGDGAAIPVMMAPPDGFCELPAMTEARAQPLVARAGDGVLIVGGMGASGPLSSAEYYDATAGAFSAVRVPPVLGDDQGFTGTALATLPDGRVALVGGPHSAFVVFDPATRAFATDPTLIDARAFHAAIATGDQEVLVAGGCSGVAALRCGGVPRLQTVRYQLTRLGLPDPAAILAGAQVSPQLFDLGVQLDGRRGYVLAGGSGAAGRVDRFALDDANATSVAGGRAHAAALDGGAVLTAFADDAAAADGAASVIAPGASAAQPVAAAPARSGVRLIALEDGRVVGFGGDPDGAVLLYDPTRDAWTSRVPASPGQTGALTAPSLVRLADGTVLVIGGAVSARAWLYRPSLVGPASGSVIATPTSDVGRGMLTAADPATVVRTVSDPPAWRLIAPGATPGATTMATALLGGPRMATGAVSAVVQVRAGGAALLAQVTGPGEAIAGQLAPGAPPQLIQLAAGGSRTVCSGSPPVAAFDPDRPVTLGLAIHDGRAELSIDSDTVLTCGVAASARGAWGIASLGGGELAVDSVTVSR